MKNLQGLFLAQLADMYDGEKRIAKAAPKFAKAASREELRNAFVAHLEETEGHVKKLEAVFTSLGERAKGATCHALVGLLKEADEMISDNKGTLSVDAALVAAAQKIEHYEIATYGCLRQWARQLGHSGVDELLGQILEEEKTEDRKLNVLAVDYCNGAANQAEETVSMHQ
jgi:ferritin-like metal-binding protein YciE